MKYDKSRSHGNKTPYVLKIVEKKVPFNEEGKQEVYCLRPAYNKVMDFKDIAKHYVSKCGLNDRVAELAVTLIVEGICRWIESGYAVNLPNIGTLKPVVNSKSHLNPHECSTGDVTSIKIQFYPCKDINRTLAGVALRVKNRKEFLQRWDEKQAKKL